jgi:hypothetical protein
MPSQHVWHACRHGFVLASCRCPDGGDQPAIRDRPCPEHPVWLRAAHDEFVQTQETSNTCRIHVANERTSLADDVKWTARADSQNGVNFVGAASDTHYGALMSLSWHMLALIDTWYAKLVQHGIAPWGE